MAGIKDRATGKVTAKVVAATDGPTLRGFVTEHSAHTAMVYTDDYKAYSGLPRHQAVKHSVAEYVNGVESFWAGLKRGYHGTHHHMSAKHLDCYVAEFCGRHNRRPLDTEDMMAASVRGMVGKRLTYTTLTAEPHDVAAEPW